MASICARNPSPAGTAGDSGRVVDVMPHSIEHASDKPPIHRPAAYCHRGIHEPLTGIKILARQRFLRPSLRVIWITFTAGRVRPDMRPAERSSPTTAARAARRSPIVADRPSPGPPPDARPFRPTSRAMVDHSPLRRSLLRRTLHTLGEVALGTHLERAPTRRTRPGGRALWPARRNRRCPSRARPARPRAPARRRARAPGGVRRSPTPGGAGPCACSSAPRARE